ncbi:hypothetical protein [uncultured Roseobacter sp.]|uniref:hypothetical protein n=1 Tax=uncultured Roseobacter sp. TaxID=114847 RepID=UPI00262471A5|nr:hypothetical protein [uncultured Roseobacter sp.]
MTHPPETEPETRDLTRLPDKPRATFDDMILPGLALGSGALLFAAMPTLIGAESFGDYVKAGLIAGTATAVSYGTNKLAIREGTVQAAIGTRGALFLSTASMAVIGFGLFTATFAGLTLNKVDDLRLAEYVQDLAVYGSAETANAQQAARIEPALRAISTDFEQKAACERLSSCISGRGTGGEGSVYRATSTQHQLALAVSAEVASGAQVRDRQLGALADLQAAAGHVLADDALSLAEQRRELQALTLRSHQAVSALREATPTDLVAAYADDLSRGVRIAGRPDASAVLSNIMAGHGQTLDAVITSSERDPTPPPRFPSRAGVSDSLSYLGSFLPIAIIVAVVELVFPQLLWLTTYFKLCAQIARNDAPSPKPTRSRRGAKQGDST